MSGSPLPIQSGKSRTAVINKYLLRFVNAFERARRGDLRACCREFHVPDGTTDSRTSAFDTVTERVGVCRDFAHLVIAFCRGLDIPARYVSGYALGLETPDFHGYVQVYLGGTWHNLDATSDS